MWTILQDGPISRVIVFSLSAPEGELWTCGGQLQAQLPPYICTPPIVSSCPSIPPKCSAPALELHCAPCLPSTLTFHFQLLALWSHLRPGVELPPFPWWCNHHPSHWDFLRSPSLASPFCLSLRSNPRLFLRTHAVPPPSVSPFPLLVTLILLLWSVLHWHRPWPDLCSVSSVPQTHLHSNSPHCDLLPDTPTMVGGTSDLLNCYLTPIPPPRI